MILDRSRRLVLVILCLSTIGGGILRFSGLDRRSVSHPEMYVPGIRLPPDISEPAERTSIRQVVTGTFSSDTHPPGYYLFMLPWTRVAGTSLPAIRLPSAILGTACIPLLYGLGVLSVGPEAGAAAAAMLAFDGYQVFWSRVARMFVPACFLGLASTLLLLWITGNPERRRYWIAIYVILILAGVATHVFFWTLFLTQMIWTFVNARQYRALPDICRAQLLALLAGCPLLAMAAYQSGTTVATLSDSVLRYVAEFLSFAFVLPTDQSGFFPASVPYSGGLVFWLIRAGLLLLSLILFGLGIRSLARRFPCGSTIQPPLQEGRVWPTVWIAAGILSTLEILFFVYMTHWLSPEQIHASLAVTKYLSVMPGALTAAALLLNRYWADLPPVPGLSRVATRPALILLTAILPFTMLALASQARPLLNERGLLFASPYLLLLLATGLLAIRRKIWTAAAIPVLLVIGAISLWSYRDMTVDPDDYNSFVSAVRPEIKAGDLVFVRKIWHETPLFYYLDNDHYHLVGRNYSEVSSRNPGVRIWVVLLYDHSPTTQMQQALAGRRPVKTITVSHATAVLYETPARTAEARPSYVPNLRNLPGSLGIQDGTLR